MNDYILLIDESGEPYLAHALFQRPNHKYIYRKENYYGPGKHLYLYTQQEVNAFLRSGGKRNLFQRMKDRFRDKLGWDEQSDLEYARQRGDKNIDNYQSKYDRTLLGRLDRSNKRKDTTLGEIRESKEENNNVVESARSRPPQPSEKKEEKTEQKTESKTEAKTEEKTSSQTTSEDKKSHTVDDMRETALKVLRGDYGNGKDRKEKLEADGYDYETIQWMAGNLNWNRNMSSAQLMRLPKKSHVQDVLNQTQSQNQNGSKSTKTEEKKTPSTLSPYQTRLEAERSTKDNQSSFKKAVYGTYKKNDDDFDIKYREERNRVGDTDFFIFKNKDGRTVIGEEDMKWILPEGVSPDSPKIKAAIIAFDQKIANERSKGNYRYTNDNWVDWANDAINNAIAEELKNK